MHKAKIILTSSLLALLFAASAGASPAEFQFSLAFSPALPCGQFHDVLGRTVWGGTIFSPTGLRGVPF